MPRCGTSTRGACQEQQESDTVAVLDSFGSLSAGVNIETRAFPTGGVSEFKAFSKAIKISEWKYAIPSCLRIDVCLEQQESDPVDMLDSFGPLSVCVNAETEDLVTSDVFTGRAGFLRPSLRVCECRDAEPLHQRRLWVQGFSRRSRSRSGSTHPTSPARRPMHGTAGVQHCGRA